MFVDRKNNFNFGPQPADVLVLFRCENKVINL